MTEVFRTNVLGVELSVDTAPGWGELDEALSRRFGAFELVGEDDERSARGRIEVQIDRSLDSITAGPDSVVCAPRSLLDGASVRMEGKQVCFSGRGYRVRMRTDLANEVKLDMEGLAIEGFLDLIEAIIFGCALRNGLGVIHAAAVGVGERVVLLGGWGHSKKTALARLAGEKGFVVASDDFSFVDSTGNALPYPRGTVLFDYDLEIVPFSGGGLGPPRLRGDRQSWDLSFGSVFGEASLLPTYKPIALIWLLPQPSKAVQLCELNGKVRYAALQSLATITSNESTKFRTSLAALFSASPLALQREWQGAWDGIEGRVASFLGRLPVYYLALPGRAASFREEGDTVMQVLGSLLA